MDIPKQAFSQPIINSVLGQPYTRSRLAEIYDEYHQPIYRYIYRRIGEIETARDLTADVFHRLLRAVHNEASPDQNLRSWLYTTAHHLVVDFYRRQRCSQHQILQEELLVSMSSPSETTEAFMDAARVRSALQQLTFDQQQVIILRYLEGLSTDEVAALIGKTTGAVKALQHRALVALQKILAVNIKGEAV